MAPPDQPPAPTATATPATPEPSRLPRPEQEARHREMIERRDRQRAEADRMRRLGPKVRNVVLTDDDGVDWKLNVGTDGTLSATRVADL